LKSRRVDDTCGIEKAHLGPSEGRKHGLSAYGNLCADTGRKKLVAGLLLLEKAAWRELGPGGYEAPMALRFYHL